MAYIFVKPIMKSRKQVVEEMQRVRKEYSDNKMSDKEYCNIINLLLEEYDILRRDASWKNEQYYDSEHKYKGYSIYANCRDLWEVYDKDGNILYYGKSLTECREWIKKESE